MGNQSPSGNDTSALPTSLSISPTALLRWVARLVYCKPCHPNGGLAVEKPNQRCCVSPPAMRRYTWLVVIGWTLIVTVLLSWAIIQHRFDDYQDARSRARMAYEKDLLYRRWSAIQGGVYVPLSQSTPANPHLIVPERDITTPSGRQLTLVNPAYMTRQVYELASADSLALGHMTSLKPLRPANAPSAAEALALRQFETGSKEVAWMEEIGGKRFMRVMRPFLTEKGCLKCHGSQGYREGDIRGGITISVPMISIRQSLASVTPTAFGYVALWICGLLGIYRTARSLGHYILQLQRVESAARQSQRAAEAANLAKTRFLANMSHEIRTPMTAILGYAELLSDATQSPADRHNCVQTIQRNGAHLLAVINDILDLSKIEVGKMTTERIACHPSQIIADIACLMSGRAQEKKLDFQVRYQGSLPQTIQSDPTRLRQILLNLTGNAIKFTEKGGVQLVVSMPDGGTPLLRFDVIDTGIGLSEQQIEQLFQPFSQADTSTTRKFGGTGLGLSISKRLAQMLGGDITIISKPGQGSTFSLSIQTGPLEGVEWSDHPGRSPAAAVASPASIQTESPLVDSISARILLAEDGPDNQRLISHHLRKVGARVMVAENGQMAVDLVRTAIELGRPFDLILMDMQMPVMDGYQATQFLRQQGYQQPIIALTAHAMAGDRQKCLDAGCDDFATKPINRDHLIATINAILHPDGKKTPSL